MEVAADQHRAAAGIARRIDMSIEQADVLAGDLHRAAFKSPLTLALSLKGRGSMVA